MVVRVTLVVTLIATDPVATAITAISLVIWHAIAPVPVVRATLVAMLFATDSVANATIATNLVI